MQPTKDKCKHSWIKTGGPCLNWCGWGIGVGVWQWVVCPNCGARKNIQIDYIKD